MSEPSIAELEARVAAAGADPIPRVDALAQLAWALRIEDFPRSHALASEARELAIAHGYTLGQARAARTMAMTIRDAAGMPRLLRLADEAKRLFDEADDPAGCAASRDFLSSIYEHIGELTLALQLSLDALAIARRLGDPIRQGYALSNVGGILAASGDVEGGVKHLDEALELFETARDPGGVATICSRLCKIFKSAGKLEEALKHATRARDAAVKAKHEWAHASALSVMADIEVELGHPAEGERLYREGLTVLGAGVTRNLLGAALQVSLARLLMARGGLAEAAAELEDALARTEGDSVSIVNICAAHEAMAELCQRRGELPAAIDHLRKTQGLREEIAQRESRNKLAQVEARAALEAARKDAEIHKLRFVELHAMQSKLVEAEKMALLGTIAAGAAHELNTPLGVLRSNAQLTEAATSRLLSLIDGEPQAAKIAAALESSRRSTDQALTRLSQVAESFKRFTQLDQADQRRYDVREGLESALALLAPAIPGGVTVVRRFDPVPEIDAWPREINQAFMTVLKNAVEAIDGSGTVTAETQATNDRVVVTVRDTGRGMSEEQATHLFDITWSDDGARTKMRMGLCAAHATTRRHGGELEVESALGKGTTLRFSFPA